MRLPDARRSETARMGAVRVAAIERRITEEALSFPESYEDRPWGDFPVFKVGENKVFGWAVVEEGAVHVTVKLTAEERENRTPAAVRADGKLCRPLRLGDRGGDGRRIAGGRARVAPRELLAQVPGGAEGRRRRRQLVRARVVLRI